MISKSKHILTEMFSVNSNDIFKNLNTDQMIYIAILFGCPLKDRDAKFKSKNLTLDKINKIKTLLIDMDMLSDNGNELTPFIKKCCQQQISTMMRYF